MYLRMPLHEPVLICLPFVRVLPEQKLMKLALSLETDLSISSETKH